MAQAVEIGTQSGAHVKVDDGVKIVGDKGDSSNTLYGIFNHFSDTGTIDLGNNVSVVVSGPDYNAHYASGIKIEADNTVLMANGLSVEVTGESAVGIELHGATSHADLGSGSRVKVDGSLVNGVHVRGIAISRASTLVADRLTIETAGDNGYGLSIDNYGSSADLGSGSTVKTTGTNGYGVFVFGRNGLAANGPAKFTATNLTVETQGIRAYGVHPSLDSEVDLGSHSQILTHGEEASGILSYGEVTAEALTVETKGAKANGIEVRGGTVNIGADSHVSAARGGGLITNGSNATLNYFGTTDKRNTVFSGGSYGASAQFTGATVNLKNSDITVDRNGKLVYGLWALGGGVISGEDLTITGAAGSRGVYAMTGSRIDLTGDLAVNMADATQMAIGTQHNDGYAASRINA
ncbi:autotransporter outer membrane beta-barrel domain-containing protein, partial [Escherichia alba]|nr:autotransporter outer membrane beta-barrel domain-containing protein [Intestinirhabdus alba]